MHARWIVLGLGVVLMGCSTGPRRIDAIDEPLELPVEVTIIDTEEFYPAERLAITLVANRGRLYAMGGGFLIQQADGNSTTISFYDVWMSEDGIRWNQLTEEFYQGVAETGFGYAFYSYDGYLWAAENISRFRNPDAPDNNRLFRSVDGIEWEIVNENYDPETGGSLDIASTDGSAYQIAGRSNTARGRTNRVNISNNGLNWQSYEFQDPSRVYGSSNMSIASMGEVPYAWNVLSQELGRFDADALVWEALLIEPTVHVQLFLTEVSERDDRFGAAFVGHDEYLYIIAGSGWSAENEWHPLQTRPNWLNDVWRSPDGIEWERVGEQLPFTEEEATERGYRYNFDTFPARVNPQVVSWRGVLYLTGGGGSARWEGEWISHGGQDAWVSRDGETWYELARVRESRMLREPLLIEPTIEQMTVPPGP